jgi:uncharacterized protein (TIGR00369 family)
MSSTAKRIRDSRFTLSSLMGPQNANTQGNVHGGVIMKMVDEAGAIVAMRHSGHPVVTVAVDSMTFMEPIYVGHLVLCKAELTYAGRTSMEVRVEVVAEHPFRGTSTLTNTAYLVYVALDENRRPTTIPELFYENSEEQARALAAQERQTYRKRQRELETKL